MGLKDKIGKSITDFIYPYMQEYYKDKGEQIVKIGDKQETYELQEKYLWFLGNEEMLATFYQEKQMISTVVNTRQEYYYNKVGNCIRVIHSGIPSLISYSKARLLLSGGIETKVYKNDKEDKLTTEVLENILKDNKINALIKNSVVTESWGKSFSWKISNDPELTEYPILELYSPFDYESVYKRNRLQKIIFKTCYNKDKYKYTLYETYGKGYIDYNLYLQQGNKLVEVPLNTLAETENYVRIEFDKKIILANEKFLDKSDYCGIVSEFDALDEAWSQYFDEIRNGRAETYVPENLMTQKTYDKFRKKYVVLGTDNRENGKNEISHNQPNIRSEEYANTINTLTSNILVNVGLSPYTVGIQDNIGANSSGDSLTKREMTSLRTRQDMIEEWCEFLEETYNTILVAYDIFNGKLPSDYLVEVEFGKYITPTLTEVIDNTVKLKNAGIIDVSKSLEEVYDDSIDEKEKQRIVQSFDIIIPEAIDFANVKEGNEV